MKRVQRLKKRDIDHPFMPLRTQLRRVPETVAWFRYTGMTVTCSSGYTSQKGRQIIF
jgi:hypothetical protein